MTTQSVTENQGGASQAQNGQSTPQNDHGKSQFGVQVSSTSTFTQADLLAEIRRAESRIGAEWRKKMEYMELEAVRGDPAASQEIRAKQEAQRRLDEANQRAEEAAELERRANEAVKRAEVLESRATARDIALRYGVDTETLLDLSDGRASKMESIAKIMPKGSSQSASPQGTQQPSTQSATRLPFHVDSGEAAGEIPIEALLNADIRNMNKQQLADRRKKLEQIVRQTPWQ